MTTRRFRNHGFSLRQLQYALAVAETGGFGSAAERCGVSQPSLSVQVAKLEGLLGVQLFERLARGVLVTEVGTSVLSGIASILRAAEELEITAKTLNDPYATPLRVGVIPTIAPYLLPAIAAEIRQPNGIRVHWLELQTPVCEEALQEGRLDAILIADPNPQQGITEVEIGWEPFWGIVPCENPLQGPLDVDELQPYDLMLLDEGHCLRDHTLSLCGRPETRHSPYRSTSLPTLVQMVAAGMGISVLPATAIPVETGRADVRALSFNDVSIGRTLRLSWRTKSPRAAVLDELAMKMRGALQETLKAALVQ